MVAAFFRRMNKSQANGHIGTTGTNRTCGAVVFLGAFLLLVFAANLGSAAADEAAANSDDGWRRTKDGWEHIATWPVSMSELQVADQLPLAPALTIPAAENLPQLHPGLLAAGMCVLAGLVLRAKPAST